MRHLCTPAAGAPGQHRGSRHYSCHPWRRSKAGTEKTKTATLLTSSSGDGIAGSSRSGRQDQQGKQYTQEGSSCGSTSSSNYTCGCTAALLHNFVMCVVVQPALLTLQQRCAISQRGCIDVVHANCSVAASRLRCSICDGKPATVSVHLASWQLNQ